jgi:uncharacterized protein (DUF885 family)
MVLATASAVLADDSKTETQFRTLADEFIRGHFAARPLEGVALGWHQSDGQFVVPAHGTMVAEVERLGHYAAEFAHLPADQLSSASQEDLRILQSAVAQARFALETQRSPDRNPMFYAGALDLNVYLKRDFKPLAQRTQDMAKILRQAPALCAAARDNLESILPQAFIETAIDIAQGTASFIDTDVNQAVSALSDAAIRSDFDEARQLASKELHSYVDWLKKEKLPKADASFALGRDGYVTMLQAEFIDLPPERILEIGLRELRTEQQRFADAAAVIDPAAKPVDVFKSIQHEHPSASELIPYTRQDLEGIRQFCLDRHIVTIPSDVRARVEETLPPFRSTSFASMDTPGPFEKKATEAYYYVTPVETNWPPQQAEEWLTAFNYYTTDIVSIHEAYPGHYVQFLVLNASPASTVAKVFASYPFVEGWAHYAEQMLLEQGFGQPPAGSTASRADVIKGAKYRLAQSDEALLRLCRLCVSVKLHTQGMSIDEATRFFRDNCYYEEKPARQEALRGAFDPGYLYYSLGKLMILKLRHDWQEQEGSQFSLQRFHDTFLAHGTPPIPLLRKLLLKNSQSNAL